MDSFVSSFQGWRTTGRPAAAGRCSLALMLCVSLGVCGSGIERYLSSGPESWGWKQPSWVQGSSEKLKVLKLFVERSVLAPTLREVSAKHGAALREGGGRGKDVLQRLHGKGARVTKLNASTNQWESQLGIWLTQHHPANWWYSWLLG